MTTENESAKRLPIRYAPGLPQRTNTAEIVEDERTAEPGPVRKHGDGDRDKPAQDEAWR